MDQTGVKFQDIHMKNLCFDVEVATRQIDTISQADPGRRNNETSKGFTREVMISCKDVGKERKEGAWLGFSASSTLCAKNWRNWQNGIPGNYRELVISEY